MAYAKCGRWPEFSRRRRVFVHGQVRASRVVVSLIRTKQMAEMPLTEHYHVVKAVPSDRTDDPFRTAVLPWRAWRDRSIANAHRPNAPDEDVTVGAVAVTDEVSRRLPSNQRPRSAGAQSIQPLGGRSLPARAFGGGRDAVSTIRRAVETRSSAPRICHRCDGVRVIVKEGFPPLGRRRLPFAIYFATVVCPTSMPSFRSSPWIRGAPHNGLAHRSRE